VGDRSDDSHLCRWAPEKAARSYSEHGRKARTPTWEGVQGLVPADAWAVQSGLLTTSARLLLAMTVADCSTRTLRIRAVHPIAKLRL
jgi:hypothetical protein